MRVDGVDLDGGLGGLVKCAWHARGGWKARVLEGDLDGEVSNLIIDERVKWTHTLLEVIEALAALVGVANGGLPFEDTPPCMVRREASKVPSPRSKMVTRALRSP